MDPTFWRTAWREGRTAFHREEVNPTLVVHAERLLGGGPKRVLVPLCGKTHDLAWLADLGHDVVGVELAEAALQDLFTREGVEPRITEVGVRLWDSGRGWRVIEGDVLALTSDVIGRFDRVWDRAALVALDPERRVAYARVIEGLLKPDGAVLLETFDFESARKPGPPHAVPAAEIAALWPRWQTTRLEQRDITAESVARGWNVDRVVNEVWWLEVG